MKIIVVLDKEKSAELEVEPTSTIEDVKALCEVVFGVPFVEQAIYFKKLLMADGNTLAKCGISGLDKVRLVQKSKLAARQEHWGGHGHGQPQRQLSHAEMQARRIIEYYKSNPRQLQRLRQANPRMFEVIHRQRVGELAVQVEKGMQQSQQKRSQYDIELAKLQNMDESDPEVQRKIQQLIKKKNIEENYKFAVEVAPESFQRVDMLYINAFINNEPVTAFVDSGAQNSNISRTLAEKCNILRLMDQRFHGTAVGVGTTKILGRIHSVPLYINGQYFPIALHVLDNLDMGFLFGLDMLKRHKCIIDLENEKLVFTLAKVEAKFLNHDQVYEQVYKEQLGEEAPVRELMQMGVRREQAQQILINCKGNIQMARMMVMQLKQGY